MWSPLLDPTPTLGIGLLAIFVLLVWGMKSVPADQRGAVARVVATHVGVTTAVLALLSTWVGRSVGPGANPFIGRVIQIFMSAALLAIVSVIASKRIADMRGPVEEAPPLASAGAKAAKGETPGIIVVLAFAAVIGVLFLGFWILLSRAR